MSEIQTPLTIANLDIKPPLSGALQIDPKMLQCFATLMGFWQNKRIPLKSSPSGILFSTSPQIEDILHVTADEADYNYQGEKLPCTEVMVMAHPDNAGRVWVRTKTAALTTNAWPLEAGDVTGFTITNLSMLRLLIPTNGEKAIIAYSM
jgi:hypothetical protein